MAPFKPDRTGKATQHTSGELPRSIGQRPHFDQIVNRPTLSDCQPGTASGSVTAPYHSWRIEPSRNEPKLCVEAAFPVRGLSARNCQGGHKSGRKDATNAVSEPAEFPRNIDSIRRLDIPFRGRSAVRARRRPPKNACRHLGFPGFKL